MSESRPPCESCRIYSISEHGDIFAASSQEKRAPRCVAYAKSVMMGESEASVLLGFRIGPLRRFLLTDDFKNGYPTKRKPARLVDGAQRQCGIAYAVFSQQGRNLFFETCIGAMAPPGSRTAPRGDPIRYIVSCPLRRKTSQLRQQAAQGQRRCVGLESWPMTFRSTLAPDFGPSLWSRRWSARGRARDTVR